uniref:protein-serine/threonine phosphatase n=1 Tax=Globisporangium ultimum (strain ATCC 200006 / CBS 805.95 / DAOM BR144) TaxID=431595 RepID=K3WGL1_GLOUD
MGCQHSKDEHMALRPSSHSDANARPRLSLSQLLLQHSKQQDPNAAHHVSSHRDVFSIFAEHGMVLEHLDMSQSQSHPVHSTNPHDDDTAQAETDCSPVSPSGSVFSTATTASDSERTQVTAGPFVVVDDDGKSATTLRLSVGAYSNRGKRKENEDRLVCVSQQIRDDIVAYFGVYDGHGGSCVAEYLAKELHGGIFERMRNSPRDDMKTALTYAFSEADDEILHKQLQAGSTAVALLVQGSKALIASVGDSQAVLCTRNGQARNYCTPHTPDSATERARILAANGKITDGRIFGFLGVSRAFGDLDFKTGRGEFKNRFKGDLVIATPDVVEHDIAAHDEFIVLACDGLFDVMTPQQVVDFVRKKLALHGHVQHACEELVSYALSIGSEDNVTAVIVCFSRDEATTPVPPASEISEAVPPATAASAAAAT